MNEQSVREGIEKAIARLFANQPDIFELTPESGQTEWNLAYHLACEVRQFFPGFDCDLELIKPEAGNRRPDIVLHKRNTHKFNFLVIELKRDNAEAMIGDAGKIEEYWFAEPYLYQFGAPINLNRDHSYQFEIHVNQRNHKNANRQ